MMLPLARTGLTTPAVVGRGLSEGLGGSAASDEGTLDSTAAKLMRPACRRVCSERAETGPGGKGACSRWCLCLCARACSAQSAFRRRKGARRRTGARAAAAQLTDSTASDGPAPRPRSAKVLCTWWARQRRLNPLLAASAAPRGCSAHAEGAGLVTTTNGLLLPPNVRANPDRGGRCCKPGS